MDHPVAVAAQLGDLVLQLELSSLEFRYLEVIDGRVAHGVLNFPFERLVFPFKLAQMHLQRHASVPPIAVPTARHHATTGRGRRRQNVMVRCKSPGITGAALAPPDARAHSPGPSPDTTQRHRGARMAPQLSDEEIVEFEAELARLKEEHRDLDGAIEALLRMVAGDQLQIQRLKKRKLVLKDRISYLEDQLTPDIIA